MKVTRVKINWGFSFVGTVANITRQITFPPKARLENSFLKINSDIYAKGRQLIVFHGKNLKRNCILILMSTEG